MTEAEVARDLRAVLEKVRRGTEVVIEQDSQPVAILRAAEAKGGTFSECISLARRREAELGGGATLDPDFAADVEEIVSARQPWNPDRWV